MGDTLTLTAVPHNLGLAIYTLTLTSGASATVTYANEVRGALGSDARFEIVSAYAEMYRAEFVLRALAPGSTRATVSATGEVEAAVGAYMWGGGTSPALTLTILS